MRITGGFLKGRRILFCRKKSRLRPTQSIVREAVFDMLAGEIQGKKVADFFAGTGALGFEALSRGAESAIFVDSSIDAIEIIKRNAELLNIKESVRILKMKVEKAIKNFNEDSTKFDLIFIDPPYIINKDRLEKIFSSAGMIMNNGGIIVLETGSSTTKFDVTDISCFERIKEKLYGSTRIQIYKKKRTSCSLSR